MNSSLKRSLFPLLSVLLWTPAARADVDYNYGADEGAIAAANAPRFPSPQGRWAVAFQRDNPLANEPLRHIRYIVSFYYPNQRTAVAVTVFIDVLGTDPKTPSTPLKDLMAGIVWSPKEDIAVLPQERWPDTRPTKARQAISLMPTSSWQTGDFPLEATSLFWTDPITVIGNWVGHCLASVGKFDGTTGKMTVLADAPSPFGYQIVSTSNGILQMKKVLDGCADPKTVHDFHPDCITLDLRFMRREVAACP